MANFLDTALIPAAAAGIITGIALAALSSCPAKGAESSPHELLVFGDVLELVALADAQRAPERPITASWWRRA